MTPDFLTLSCFTDLPAFGKTRGPTGPSWRLPDFALQWRQQAKPRFHGQPPPKHSCALQQSLLATSAPTSLDKMVHFVE